MAMKKLAVIAHPDLFQKYPKESKINDTSFKELRHYLEEVRRVIDVEPEARDREKDRRVPHFNITFFVRQRSSVDSLDKDKEDTGPYSSVSLVFI